MSSAAAVGPGSRTVRTTSPAPGLLELGRQLFDQQQFHDAALALQRRMRLAPHDAEARLLLALSLLHDGQASRAAMLLEPSRATGSLDAGTCRDVGVALLVEDPTCARTWLESAVRAAPDDAVAVHLLEDLRRAQGAVPRRTGRHRLEQVTRLRRRPA